jgi:hypothetical protein
MSVGRRTMMENVPVRRKETGMKITISVGQ